MRKALVNLIQPESDLEVCGQSGDVATAIREVIRLNPDLITVDISLQESSGVELIGTLKSVVPKTKILVLSVHHESVYAMRVIRAGADGYVMKQDAISKVLEAIRHIRNGRVYVSETISNQVRSQAATERERGDFPVSNLSDRELEVVEHLGNGLLTREIAIKLRVAVATVEKCRSNIKRKLGLTTGGELIQFCVRWVAEKRRQAGDPRAPKPY